jgi:hypothetical protein
MSCDGLISSPGSPVKTLKDPNQVILNRHRAGCPSSVEIEEVAHSKIKAHVQATPSHGRTMPRLTCPSTDYDNKQLTAN